MARTMRKIGRAMRRARNAQSIGKARLETEGGGLFGGKKKEYFETEVLGKKYRVKKTKKQRQHRLPVKVDVDTVTGEVTANPRKSKVKTREQVRAMQQKAVRFLRDVVKNSDKADEIEAMSIDDYAAKKHVTLSNPRRPFTSSHSRRMRDLHGRIQTASKRTKVPVEFEVQAGGAPTYIVRGRRMSGQEALAELSNPEYHVTTGFSKRSLYHRAKEAAYEQGLTFSTKSATDGRLLFVLDGEAMTPGEAAKRLVIPVVENPNRPVTAYGLTRGRNFQQEWYESASGDARIRAHELRKLGFRVSVASVGPQVTSAGVVKMTLLSIADPGDREIPPPDKLERNPGKPLLGSGERFAELESKLAARPGVTSPRALAAAIGRRKYGKKKFQQLAARGRKRAAKRGNPKSEAYDAQQLYETFHQEPPSEVLEFDQEIYRPRDYTVLGKLIELRLRSLGLKLDFENEDVLLASNAAGTQMYFIGGNQDLSDVITQAGDGVDQTKDFIYLGEIDGVVYRARKEFTQFEETDWDHKLGEGGHKRPVLMYDKLNEAMYMVGGEYQVKYEGIIN